MPPVTIPPKYIISVNDVETVSIDYSKHLDNSELLIGSPTVPAVTDITISNERINSKSYRDKKGKLVLSKKAAQFSITSAVIGDYTIVVSVTTDANPGPRTFIRQIIIGIV